MCSLTFDTLKLSVKMIVSYCQVSRITRIFPQLALPPTGTSPNW